MELRGEACAVFEAYKRVEACVDEVDDVLLLIEQCPEKLRVLAGNVGTKHHFCKWVSAETGVRIWVPEPTDQDRWLSLEGPISAVQQAFALISDRLFGVAVKKQSPRVTTSIPASAIGTLLGKGGSTAQAIRELTFCAVDLENQGRRPEERQQGERQNVKLSGLVDNVELALKVVKLLCPEAKREGSFINKDDCLRAALAEQRREGLFYPSFPRYVERFKLSLPPAATSPINPYFTVDAERLIQAEARRQEEATQREREAAARKGDTIKSLGAGGGAPGAAGRPGGVLLRSSQPPPQPRKLCHGHCCSAGSCSVLPGCARLALWRRGGRGGV